MKINIVGGEYNFNACFTGGFADGVVDLQTCINYYPQSAEIGGGQNVLIPTSGLKLLHKLPNKIKGMKLLNNNWVLVVSGSVVYRIKDETISYVGSIGSTENVVRVSIAENGKQAVIATGQKLFSIDLNTWQTSEITTEDPAISYANFIDFLDGYFVYSHYDNTGRFGWSELYKTKFPTLNFATSEGRPDKIMSVIVLGRELWLLGAQSTEVFYNSGDKNQPFRRISGAFMTFGCEAPYSVAKASGSLIFLGRTEEGGRQIIQTHGYQYKRISTHAIEARLQKFPRGTIWNATAFAYQEHGHYFYAITLEGAKLTLVYDLTTGIWHQRAYLNENQILEAHRAGFFAYNGKNLVGDRENGNIYEITSESTTDNGRAIYRERTLPAISQEKMRVRHDRFEVETKADSSENAKLHLSWSDDYGKTWTQPKAVKIEAKEYNQSFAVWRRLGTAKNRSYRISTTSTVRIPLVSAYLNTQLG